MSEPDPPALPRVYGLIYQKELKDTLRDRRTLATMLLVPMVVYPMALVFGSEALLPNNAVGSVRVTALEALPPPIFDALSDAELEFHPAQPSTEDEATRIQRLLTEDDVVIVSSATAGLSLAGLGTARLRLYFDDSAPRAIEKKERVEACLRDLARQTTLKRLRAHQLPDSTVRPMTIEAISVAATERSGNRMLGLILPTLVLTFIAISCFYPAVDLTAGEKERKTLATLLSAPVRISDVVLGKYLAVLTVGSLAGLLNVTVLGVTVYRLMLGGPQGEALQFALSPLLVIGLLLGVIAIAAPVAALMLGAASLARSFRDASTLLTPVLLICLLPLGLTMSPDARLSPEWAAVPLAGAALLLRALLAGEGSLGELLLVLSSSLAVTALLLFLVARIFADERALFSTEGRRVDLRGILLEPPTRSPATAAAFAGVVFVLHYYGGALVTWWPPVVAIPITQVVAQVLPTIGLSLWLRHCIRARALLGLRVPSPRAIAAALLLGGGAWLGLSLPSAWLTDALIGGQAQVGQALAASLGIDRLSTLQLVLAFALVPAVCEELAFRGVFYGLLIGRLSAPSAVLIQALTFGLVHGSIHRFLPTALLGWILGRARWKSGSLLPGIVIHALTNTILIVLERQGPAFGLSFGGPTPWALLGVLAVGLGLWALPRVDRALVQ